MNKPLSIDEFQRLLTAKPKSKTLEQARALAAKGRPWEILISNTQESSYKFWKASGAALDAPVTISWGRIGSAGRSATKDWAYVEKALAVKLRKGYVYGMPEAGESPEDKAKKASKYVNQQFKDLFELGTDFRDDTLPKIWKEFARISKRYNLDLYRIQEAVWLESMNVLGVVQKSLTQQKQTLEIGLGVKLVDVPNLQKVKEPQVPPGKQWYNPEAEADLKKLHRLLSRFIPPITNYWDNAAGGWDWDKLYKEIDPSESLEKILEEASGIGSEVEFAVSDWYRKQGKPEWKTRWEQQLSPN